MRSFHGVPVRRRRSFLQISLGKEILFKYSFLSVRYEIARRLVILYTVAYLLVNLLNLNRDSQVERYEEEEETHHKIKGFFFIFLRREFVWFGWHCLWGIDGARWRQGEGVGKDTRVGEYLWRLRGHFFIYFVDSRLEYKQAYLSWTHSLVVQGQSKILCDSPFIGNISIG